MAKAKRNIGLEILRGIREIKRGEHGRVITVPSVASVRERRQVVAQEGPPFEIKAPNAVTIAAMRDARSTKRAKFRSAPGLFNDLEEAGAAKARKPAKKRR